MLLDQLDLDQIQDVAQAKQAVVGLLNLVEALQATVRELQAEVQRLRDENNHLKGEQGRPDFKPNRGGKQPGPGPDHSSEAERRKPQVWQKGGKLAKITINREAVLTVDQAQLPADAEFKGYEDSIVQDVVLRTDNVLFHKEKYYSPSVCRTYLAELPPGYTGQFGPGIKALALVQYFACNVAEPKILEFFTNVGIHLSAGELSNWLIKDGRTCTPRRPRSTRPGWRAARGTIWTTRRRGSMARMSIVMWCAIRCIQPTSRRPARTG